MAIAYLKYSNVLAAQVFLYYGRVADDVYD
jgi:hypothetical protein